ncbi:hypothetical protein [Nocardia asiatica]|uniref:hypothetical protein n=1 Tax=Nocardia asiatica TaxID=209252 RepID=UPI0024545749|nr:hypothetical protein [Nocardia asiatica]
MTTGAQDRRGSLWTGDDYQALFAALATSAPDSEIAAQLGRSLDGLRGRAKFLLLDSYTPALSLRKLRQMASQPGFDWESLARDAHTFRNLPYWDASTDERLILAWARNPAPTMAALVEEFGVGEQDIARRCMALKLAQNRVEVVDHLGAEPGGELEYHARLGRDKANTAVGVLVITSATGAVLHLSLHPDIDAAAQACGEVDETALEDLPAVWTIATRVLGEGSTRATKTGTWAQRSATEPHTDAVSDPVPAQAVPRWWQLLKPRTR